MLQSFVGIIDEFGLRSLTTERDDQRPAYCIPGNGRAIWAVLDSSNLNEVLDSLANDEGRQALKLLSIHARSIGSLLV